MAFRNLRRPEQQRSRSALTVGNTKKHWQNVSAILPGTEEEMQIKMPIDPLQTKRFYRVKIWQQ